MHEIAICAVHFHTVETSVNCIAGDSGVLTEAEFAQQKARLLG